MNAIEGREKDTLMCQSPVEFKRMLFTDVKFNGNCNSDVKYNKKIFHTKAFWALSVFHGNAIATHRYWTKYNETQQIWKLDVVESRHLNSFRKFLSLDFKTDK